MRSGIAVLGSIATSTYRSSVDVAGLPPEAAEAAGESVGAAVRVASGLPGQQAAALVDDAGVAFTDALEHDDGGWCRRGRAQRDRRVHVRPWRSAAGHRRGRGGTGGSRRDGWRQHVNDAPPELDPRVERSRRVILEATLDELGEVGYGAMSIESVARRAGVGKATIYRHWQGKLDLLSDALATLKRPVPPPTEGSTRERIVALLEALVETLGESRWSRCMPALIDAAARDETVQRFHQQFVSARRQIMVDLIVEGISSGELSADLDPVLTSEVLAGPIFYRRLMTGEPFGPAFARRIVDLVLPAPITS